LLDANCYGEAAAKLVSFTRQLREDYGISLEYLDLGGGFASSAKLKSQYLPGEQVTPSFSQYAEAIAEGLGELLDSSNAPRLILETGRALIDEAGTLITTVVANKRLGDSRRAVVIDAGVNLLFTSFWYRHSIVPTKPCSGVPEPTVVYGNLCMNIDVVAENLMLPPLEVGSPVLVRPVGAYNVTQSMQFIHLRPAVILVGPDKSHAPIRRAETLDDLVINESVPDWLE
ncbi:MAG: diaminopimelate decarboxylase, partial [Proteobacteria bacterium]|nr:diaminopimelate decarboxylase [Pseudomonadota bacterium]